MISVIFLYDCSLHNGERQYDCRGVDDISLYEKKVTVDFYILCNAAVRDKDI